MMHAFDRSEAVLICGRERSSAESKRAEQGNNPCSAPELFDMHVFGNNFTAVDVREELCYHSRPEKAKFGYASYSLNCFISSIL